MLYKGRRQNSHIQTTYKPHTNHKRSSVRSHTLAPTSICDLSHSLCWRPLTDLGHIRSATYVYHPLWFVCFVSPLSGVCLQNYRYRADKSTIFWYEGPLGPNYQFWKESHIEIVIGRPYKPKKLNGCLFRQKSDYLSFYTT